MAKIVNLSVFLLVIAVFAIGLDSTFVLSAFADDKYASYSHQHITSTWDNSLVCGDHKCAPGETPQYPHPVLPVR